MMILRLRFSGQTICVLVCLGCIASADLWRHEAILQDDPGHTHHEQEGPSPLVLVSPIRAVASGALTVNGPRSPGFFYVPSVTGSGGALSNPVTLKRI